MIEKPKKERRFLKALGRVGEILIQEILLKVGSNLIKRIGGKKTLPSILILFISISLFAQYPNTGNKQRLGFQTSADGLVWRGSISDTSTIQPVSNQNAWVILDTVNLKIYSFDFTSNVWNQLPSGTTIDTTSLSNRINLKLNIADTASMLTNYLRTGVASNSYLPLTGGTLSKLSNLNNFTDSILKILYTPPLFANDQNITGLAININNRGYTTTGITSEASTVLNNAIGVKGKATQSDVNGTGIAYGIIGEAAASGSGTNGSTYAGYFNNTSTVGGNHYGLYVSTASGGDYGIYQTGTGINYFGSNSTFTGNITGNSFIKSGGTSSQFLKADGSVDANTYLTTGTAASTYLPLAGGTLTGAIKRQDNNYNESPNTFYFNLLNYFARRDNEINGNQTAQISFTDRPGTFQFQNAVRTSDIHLMTAHNWNGSAYGQYLDTTLSVVANQDGGRIGISKLNPAYKLDVNGTFNASGNSLIGGTLGVTGATTLTGAVTVNNATVLNEGSGDFDTRIESDGNANMVFVDASTDRVGIGTGSPSKTLDINGEVKIATVTATPTALLGKDGSNVVGEVTTVAQTGLMTRGSTTATTGTPSAVFTVNHGLGSNPTSVIVTGAGAVGAEKLIYEVYAKNSTTFSVQVWNYDGTEAASTSVTIYWLAIK
jgi:hypothetical protein